MTTRRHRHLTGAFASATVFALALPALGGVPGANGRIAAPVDGVLRGDLGRAIGAPLEVAGRALAEYAGRLGVRAGDFRFESVRNSILGTHVRGRQHVDGVPVAGTSVAVHVLDGRIAQIEARPVSNVTGSAALRPVSRTVAVRAAQRALGVNAPLVAPAAQRLLVASDGRFADIWRVAVVALRPAVAASVDVDAGSGRVIAVADRNKYVDGTAKIFDPNPIVRLRDPSVRQPLESQQSADPDLDDPRLTAARTVMPLRELDATRLRAGFLSGPWVNVIAPGYFTVDEKPAFDITRGDPRFEGLMAYAHLDRIQRYFQSLGFRGAAAVNAESQEVVATRVEGYDNSFYQPGNDLMLLGAGGVDDGEDAEVIIHEYGHAVHDAQVPGWGDSHEGGAMGEGFGDWLAASYYAKDVSKGFQDVCIMEWDATSYSTANPTCLRRADSKKRYPEDMEPQIHADGEMWSSFLWRVRAQIGRDARTRSDNSIRLVLASHELLTTTADFGDAVAALRTAARQLRHPEWVKVIDREAKRTGFPVA